MFLNIIWTDYVMACFRTSFDTRKYLDLRQRHRDVMAEKFFLLPVHRPCAVLVGKSSEPSVAISLHTHSCIYLHVQTFCPSPRILYIRHVCVWLFFRNVCYINVLSEQRVFPLTELFKATNWYADGATYKAIQMSKTCFRQFRCKTVGWPFAYNSC